MVQTEAVLERSEFTQSVESLLADETDLYLASRALKAMGHPLRLKILCILAGMKVSGTGLRPVLDRLDDNDGAAFSEQYGAELRRAYPQREEGTTLFAFRRIFFVVIA